MRSEFFKNAKRVIIKIGSSSLTQDGAFYVKRLHAIAEELAEIMKNADDLKVVLVSSGAIPMGMKQQGLKKRPVEMPKLQALAAIGQPLLLRHFSDTLERHKITAAQILLTWDDFSNRTRFGNTKKTLDELVGRKVVPIINENDTVAVQEIEFGDNDQLSSMTASMFDADLLILLSDSNGFYADYEAGEKTRVPMVDDLNASLFASVRDVKKNLSKGGMTSKLNAIEKALKAGIPCLLADGTRQNTLHDLFGGKDVGTLFLPKLKRMASKKHWIKYISKPEGTLVIDAGAEQAMISRGKSLLSKGITETKGQFEAGASIRIQSERGTILGKGIVNFSSTELEKIRGLRSEEWEKRLGKPCLDEVLHRDNFVAEDL
jgi:glutamate 5-kinase